MGWLVECAGRRELRRAWTMARVILLRSINDLSLVVWNRGIVTCEICAWTGNRFYPWSDKGLGFWWSDLCPRCGSLGRHRLLWRYMKQEARLGTVLQRMLDIGPSTAMRVAFAKILQARYTAVDLRCPPGTVCADVAHLPFADRTFNCIVCLNVLYAVENDGRALSEMYRCCELGGIIVIREAIDSSLRETEEYAYSRQDKHGARRWYGRDFVQRLSRNSVTVNEWDPVTALSSEVRRRFGIPPSSLLVVIKHSLSI